MISLRPVFGAPARGVAVHGSPLLGGVCPASKGDLGVRGVIGPGVYDCCGLRVGDVMDLPRELSHPSSMGDSEGPWPDLGVDIGLIEGDGPGDRYDEPSSSSMENIISLDEALAFKGGWSASALPAMAEPRLGFCDGD
jgi:hypothetical protein